MVSPGGVNESILLSIGSGGVTPQKIYLKIDSDKQGYIEYPDGTYQATIAGVIDTTWTGLAGAVTLIVPKTSALFDTHKNNLYVAEFTGNLVVNNATIIDIEYSRYTTARFPNATDVTAANSTFIQSIFCPKAKFIKLNSCPNLPTSNLYKLIDDMYQLHLDGVDLTGGVLNLGGTTRGINDAALSPFGVLDYSDLIGALDSAGVTITINIIP